MSTALENTSEGTESTRFSIAQRWEAAADAGFTAVPNTLLQAQMKLGLTANDIVVLMNLVMHWWSPDQLPFPRTQTIANRSGLGLRTVQRCMNSLQDRGFITKVRGEDRTYIDLSGLKAKLSELTPGYAWRKELAADQSSVRAPATGGAMG